MSDLIRNGLFTLENLPSAGFCLKRGEFTNIKSAEILSVELPDVDGKFAIVVDYSFDCGVATSGNLVTAKQSFFMRGRGEGAINYDVQVANTFTSVSVAKSYGLTPGGSFEFNTGCEGFVFVHDFDVPIDRLTYFVRIVALPYMNIREILNR